MNRYSDAAIAPARRLDHRRVSTTMDFYSHVITGRDRFAADALANIMRARRVDAADTGEMPCASHGPGSTRLG